MSGAMSGGRSWYVAHCNGHKLSCFDAFGNRDHYDYYIYGEKTCVRHLKTTPADEACEKFVKYIEALGFKKQDIKWEGRYEELISKKCRG